MLHVLYQVWSLSDLRLIDEHSFKAISTLTVGHNRHMQCFPLITPNQWNISKKGSLFART